jgi:hypothetical protein
MSKTHHAYPKRPDLEAVMRMSAVKRWHMIDTTRIQNLAEHTANVSLLAWLIAHRCPGMFFQPADVLTHAMVHDLGEAFLGDIPTHSKILLGKELVNQAEKGLLSTSFKLPECSGEVKDLIKLCDLADGIRFIRLHGVDMTARHAQGGLEGQFYYLLQETYKDWPQEVWEFVKGMVHFYAYEADA